MGKYGDGKTVYFAASIGEAYMRTEIPYLRQIVKNLLDWMGVQRNILVEATSEQRGANLETGLVKKDKELLLVAINHDEEAFTGTFKILTNKKTAEVKDISSEKVITSKLTKGYISFETSIPGRDCRAYHLY
jgi:predicted TIM-barrel fold metal-dependent hydrolase